jgi:transcriptional regulator with XRE-family HTH domain
MQTTKTHHGRNIKRLRSILDIKQESIAFALNMTQQNFSVLEQKQEIENPLLEKIAKMMNVPVDLIKNFNEEGVINIISSTLHDNSGSVLYNPTFNPIDKIIELYERIIQEKNEKIELFERLTKK